MNNDTFNNHSNSGNPMPTGQTNSTPNNYSGPTMRPLQPVGARYVRSDSQSANQTPNDSDTLVFKDTPPKSPTRIGVICGVAGLVLGGVVIFALMQLIKKPEPKCEECNCPQCPTNASTTNNLTTSFLTLEPQSQNMLYSPLSIRYGLSLLNEGATGSTKTEISKTLGEETLPQYANVADKLSLANAVFIRNTYADSVLPSYTNAATQKYNAEILYDDFASSTNMNNWVSNKTFGLINQIGIQPTENTKMVLTNALAIQMNWQHQFSTNDTYGVPFYKEDNSEITATTMNMTTSDGDISYYQDDQITMLSLPLESVNESTNLEFVAVMPSNSLSDYLTNLDLSAIEENLKNATPASSPEKGLVVYVPKFKYDYELNFKQDLESLGITQAFSPNADFSNMTSNPKGLYVSDAVHKANIDFSEEGIKAAAVTAFAMVDGALAPDDDAAKPVTIRIDHPFLFLIRDKSDGTVWFTGTVYEPNLWSADQSAYQL